jgi:cell division protein FtsW (lipid II flippase)
LRLGAFAFQPSEFCKGFLIVCLAAFLNTRTDRLLALPIIFLLWRLLWYRFYWSSNSLIWERPSSFLAIALFMFLMCGFKMRWLALGTVVGCLSLPAGLAFSQGIPEEQVESLFRPGIGSFRSRLSRHSVQDCYWQRHAFGKGWLQGTQSQLNFLTGKPYGFYFCGGW